MRPHPHWVDYAVIGIYFTFVLGIGFVLKKYMKTSTDFFLSGRSIPAWITGLAFLSANLGAQEVIGMGASGAKYGIATSHFYWVGAIPAMVFVGIFMMPFYYGSRARSVPEYLKLRFDEKTRGLNAISFAVMTVFSSGVSMYAMGKLLQLLLGWNFNAAIIVSALIVLAYTFLGGLTSAIYNEVLQFFLIVIGFIPLVFLGLKDVGGWDGLKTRIGNDAMVHSWKYLGSPSANPMGVEWFSMLMGLGFVLSFGYWCTDFLVVQRAMAADSMTSARRTPLIAAFPKMLFPFLVILPGMIAGVVSAASMGGSMSGRFGRRSGKGGSGSCLRASGKRRNQPGRWKRDHSTETRRKWKASHQRRQSRARLRSGDSHDAGSLFSFGIAGIGIVRPDGFVYVWDGRQHDCLQFGLDLRYLPGLH